MSKQDVLSEECKPHGKVFQTKERWAIIIAISLLGCVMFLHFFGDWSTSRTVTISSEEEMSRETKYSYENKCLLFKQSHLAEVSDSGKGYNRNSNNLLRIVLNSFRFTFTGHIVSWLIIIGTLIILYWFADSNKNREPK